ncbi:hypothetical protein GCM10027168_24160 [Streptomyces capparidis]
MSLPLTRRIARAALLVAAGAVPVAGAAGAASAAELPLAAKPGGLTQPDLVDLGNKLDTASRNSTEAIGKTGSRAIGTTVPAAGRTVGSVSKTALPAVPALQKAVGSAIGQTAKGVGETAGNAGKLVGGTAETVKDVQGAARGTQPEQPQAQTPKAGKAGKAGKVGKSAPAVKPTTRQAPADAAASNRAEGRGAEVLGTEGDTLRLDALAKGLPLQGTGLFG